MEDFVINVLNKEQIISAYLIIITIAQMVKCRVKRLHVSLSVPKKFYWRISSKNNYN